MWSEMWEFTLITGMSSVRITNPPTTITYIPAIRKPKFAKMRRHSLSQNSRMRMSLLFCFTKIKKEKTCVPSTDSEVAGEIYLNDAGAIVEKQPAVIVRWRDQNALQPDSLKENAAESDGVLWRRLASVLQLDA